MSRNFSVSIQAVSDDVRPDQKYYEPANEPTLVEFLCLMVLCHCVVVTP